MRAVNADGQEFREDISIGDREARGLGPGAFRDLLEAKINIATKRIVRAMERAENIAGIAAIDPWKTPFLTATGISTALMGNRPAAAPATPIEPVPLSELAAMKQFYGPERALEFIG